MTQSDGAPAPPDPPRPGRRRFVVHRPRTQSRLHSLKRPAPRPPLFVLAVTNTVGQLLHATAYDPEEYA